MCFLRLREPLIRPWCGICLRCRLVWHLLGSSRSSPQLRGWKKAGHSLRSSFRDCWVWWQLRPTWYLLACCTWKPYSGGSRPRDFSEGKTASHDQGHVAMPTFLRHVEEALILVYGSRRSVETGAEARGMDASPSSSFWRGTPQVTYVTLVPRSNEMLHLGATLPASLPAFSFIPWSLCRLHCTCFIPAGHYVAPPVTSCPLFGLITHDIQSRSRWRHSPKCLTRHSVSFLRGTRVTYHSQSTMEIKVL